jgi:hypothetical protein
MSGKLKTFEEYYSDEQGIDFETGRADEEFPNPEETDISMDEEVDDELAENVESLINRFGLGKVANFIDKLTR